MKGTCSSGWRSLMEARSEVGVRRHRTAWRGSKESLLRQIDEIMIKHLLVGMTETLPKCKPNDTKLSCAPSTISHNNLKRFYTFPNFAKSAPPYPLSPIQEARFWLQAIFWSAAFPASHTHRYRVASVQIIAAQLPEQPQIIMTGHEDHAPQA